MAGWSQGGAKLDLPASPSVYVAQIADVKSVKGKDMGKGERDRFQWGVDVWVGNQWMRRSIYTGTDFCDPSKVSNPQFIPELIKLVRACGFNIPTSAAEAAAWDPNCLIGQRFGIRMVEEDGLVQRKLVRLEQGPVAQAGTQVMAPAQAPVPAQPQATPPYQYQGTVPQGAPPPQAPQGYAPPADPFADDAGAQPAGTGTHVAGPVDNWR